ncbi:MAG TPA: hypothetical protein VFA70_02030 [Dehalococcoidia bacterium]|nr:hypothetical protein [Dehalococcoidia bacterium]
MALPGQQMARLLSAVGLPNAGAGGLIGGAPLALRWLLPLIAGLLALHMRLRAAGARA